MPSPTSASAALTRHRPLRWRRLGTTLTHRYRIDDQEISASAEGRLYGSVNAVSICAKGSFHWAPLTTSLACDKEIGMYAIIFDEHSLEKPLKRIVSIHRTRKGADAALVKHRKTHGKSKECNMRIVWTEEKSCLNSLTVRQFFLASGNYS
jgi:hypothetical protein